MRKVQMRSLLAWLLALFGLLLPMPRLWSLIFPPLSGEDEIVAFKTLVQIPLQEIEQKGFVTFTFSTPDDASWKRIRGAWGEPGYILAAAAPTGSELLYCFKDLDLSIQGMRGSEVIPVEEATSSLYPYSTKCSPCGVKFLASPGENLVLHVKAPGNRSLPRGDLIIAHYWTSEIKDRLVGLSLDKLLRGPFNVLGVIGVIFLTCSAWLTLTDYRRRRAARP
jgi:hypothetical protein